MNTPDEIVFYLKEGNYFLRAQFVTIEHWLNLTIALLREKITLCIAHKL